MLTIDASVWLSAVFPSEPNHQSSRLFLDAVIRSDLALVVPTLLTVELHAAMARRKDSAAHLMTEMMGLLSSMNMVHWVILGEKAAGSAATVATRTQLRAGDSIYGATALEYGTTLVSLDKEHLERLASVVKVVTPEQAMADFQVNP